MEEGREGRCGSFDLRDAERDEWRKARAERWKGETKEGKY